MALVMGFGVLFASTAWAVTYTIEMPAPTGYSNESFLWHSDLVPVDPVITLNAGDSLSVTLWFPESDPLTILAGTSIRYLVYGTDPRPGDDVHSFFGSVEFLGVMGGSPISNPISARSQGASSSSMIYTADPFTDEDFSITGFTFDAPIWETSPNSIVVDEFFFRFNQPGPPIPEPGTMTLVAFGLVGMRAISRRRIGA
jgi:hypothetical protein